MTPSKRLAAALSLLAVLAPTAVRATIPTMVFQIVQPTVAFPTQLRFAPDGRLFYLERLTGRVMVFETPTSPSASPWTTLPVRTGGERGLLGMALHPAFADSPYVYLFYSDAVTLFNRIVRMTDSSGVGTQLAIIRDSLPSLSDFHQGGRLAFGPDGMLYASIGDQTTGLAPRDPADIRGKILRMTTTGRAAPANPFGAHNPAGAMGVRNPFGICFDPLTGEGYFTENGPDCNDELNRLTIGADYGWDQSNSCGLVPPGTLAPLWSFTPTIAPTGCAVYRGTRYPQLDGDLLFTAFNDGDLRRAVFRAGEPDVIDTLETLAVKPGGAVLDVTVGPDGYVYIATLSDIRILLPSATSDVGGAPRIEAFALAPNPFRRELRLALPAGAAPARVAIADVAGRRVRAWDGVRGALTWDGRDDAGRAVPHGVYFVRMDDGTRPVTRRVVRLDP